MGPTLTPPPFKYLTHNTTILHQSILLNSYNLLSFSKNSSNFFSLFLFSFIAMASPARTFFAFILAVVALFFAAANAQDLSPAPSPDAGAAGSVSSSVAMIGASVVLSLMAILKH